MKMLALLAALIAGTPAQARSLQTVQTEVFHNVVINDQPTQYVGELVLNFATKEIHLNIFNDICGSFTPTPPGTMRCMAMPALITSMTVPMHRKDNCGSRNYMGVKDDTRVDGMRVEIRAADNSKRFCDDLANLFEVSASQFNPWNQKTTTYQMQK